MNDDAPSEPGRFASCEKFSFHPVHARRGIGRLVHQRSTMMLWQVLFFAGQIAVSAAPVSAQWWHFGQHTEEEGESNSPLFTRLSESAAAHLKPYGLEADLALVDGEFAAWEVVVCDADAERLLVDLGQPTGEDLIPALLAWARKLNEALVDSTTRCFAEEHRELFNPDVDCELSVHVEALPIDIYASRGLALHFTGRRLILVGHPLQWRILNRLRDEFTKEHGVSPTREEDERLKSEADELALKVRDRYPEPDPENADSNTQLVYDIELQSRVIRPGESICGTITLKNTGSARLHIESSYGITNIRVLNADGVTEASRIAGRGPGASIARIPDYEYVYLKPGESITSDFVINTNSQASALGGYELSPETYLLTYGEIANVKIVGERATIRVLAEGESSK